MEVRVTGLPTVGQRLVITGAHPWAGYVARCDNAATVVINKTWHIARVIVEGMDGDGFRVFIEPHEWKPYVPKPYVRGSSYGAKRERQEKT